MKQKLINFCELLGLTWFIPLIRLATGDDPKEQFGEFCRIVALPVAAMILFFMFWSFMSTKIKTSVGQLPTPGYVWSQSKAMWATHKSEKINKQEFTSNEAFRAQVAEIVKKRQESSSPQTREKLTNELNSLKAKIGKFVATTEKEIALNTAIVTKQDNDKKSRMDTMKASLMATKKFAFDEKGELIKDPDGQPKLSDEALAKLANIQNRRVAVYESNLLQIYKSSMSTANSLIKKIEKIDKYYQIDLQLQGDQSSEANKKKLVSNKKKLDAFEKQIFKNKEYNCDDRQFDVINDATI